MRAADHIELTSTGQRIVFRRTDGEAVVFESSLPSQQYGLELADGASQEQRFEVLEGTLGFCIDGAETLLTPGGRLTVRRGTACRYWNAGGGTAHLMAEIRPALDFERYARDQSTREEPCA